MPSRRSDGQVEPLAPTVDRDELIVSHLYIVKQMAYRFRRMLPTCVQLDDLISAGRLGLVRAANSWNPSTGVAFSYYCRFRIRGQMKDELSNLLHIGPHSQRMWNGSRLPWVVSIDAKIMASYGADGMVDWITRHEFPDGLVRSLTARERVILRMRYVDGMEFAEIAPRVGLSPRRVSGIHVRIKQKAAAWYQSAGIGRAAK